MYVHEHRFAEIYSFTFANLREAALFHLLFKYIVDVIIKINIFFGEIILCILTELDLLNGDVIAFLGGVTILVRAN